MWMQAPSCRPSSAGVSSLRTTSPPKDKEPSTVSTTSDASTFNLSASTLTMREKGVSART